VWGLAPTPTFGWLWSEAGLAPITERLRLKIKFLTRKRLILLYDVYFE